MANRADPGTMNDLEYKLTLRCLYETWQSMQELCETLTESEWKTATACPGWSVQDNLSHIIGTEKALGGLGGTQHKATDLRHVKNPIGEMNEHEVDSRRHLTGAQVLKEFKEIFVARKSFFDSAPESYFTAESNTPIGKAPMAVFLSIRAMDSWVHEQDIRRALNKPGDQGSLCAELSVDRLVRTLPMVIGKRAKAPDGSVSVVTITGPVQRKIVIAVKDGRAAVVEKFDSTPVVELAFDSNTFIELATGRATRENLRDKIKITGDTDLGTKIADSLNMMI
ncbi:MAG: maleylpyruvate isomerase family mycothiol-dependent enzyme [Actinomycetota bacterium]